MNLSLAARPRASPPGSWPKPAASPSASREPCSAAMPRPSFTCSIGSRRRSGRSSDAPTSTAGFSGTASRRCPSASPTTTPWRMGATAGGASTAGTVRERPGLVPSALFHIIHNTVFLRLSDVASGLPDYEEKILLSSMDTEEDSTGLQPAQRLQHRVRGIEEGAGGGSQGGLQEAAGDLPAKPPRLPRRLHQGGDGLRPPQGRRHRPGPAAVGGEALPQGEGAHRPGGRRAFGGTAGVGLRHPHGDAGTSPGAWTTSSPGTASAWR